MTNKQKIKIQLTIGLLSCKGYDDIILDQIIVKITENEVDMFKKNLFLIHYNNPKVIWLKCKTISFEDVIISHCKIHRSIMHIDHSVYIWNLSAFLP